MSLIDSGRVLAQSTDNQCVINQQGKSIAEDLRY